METIYRFVRNLLIAGVLFFCLIVAAGVGLYHYYSHDLPKLDSLRDYNPPVVSEVFSDDGTKIGEFWNEKRIVLSPKEMPRTMINAIVASEDDRFFEHKGIDYQGIVRAFIENLKAGHVVQGGSTITQQVTKSLLLTREKTLSRKVKEAILATRIEKNFNKDEILHLYLNQTFFGNRAYGVEIAAQNYFHKTAREMNIAECAMIAGLAKAPSSYSPIVNPQQAKTRQEYVISRMYDVGFITREQAAQARNFPLKIYRAKTDKEFNLRYAPWFTEYIRRYVQKTYGEQVPYTHGLKVYTTVNLAMQKAADRAVWRGLRELDQREGYSGPLRHIDPSEIDRFAEESHLKIMKQAIENEDEFHPYTDREIADRETPLLEDEEYEAVVSKVNAKEQSLEVRLGKITGVIKVNEYGWVHKRNLNAAGYNMIYTRDPSNAFKVGDVVLVRKKTPTADDIKKGYSETGTYFYLDQKPEAESALFSYEPHSGFVRAIVGGKDFRDSEYNRAMQAIRQTGSSIKPLIYAAALDKGYTQNTIIEDSQLNVEVSPGKFWSPQNYGGGFKGPTSFRSALVNSRNIVTVRILMDVGTDYVTAYARKLGIETPIQRYYSMALGANDMKLYELSRAYGTFVTGGIKPELVFIRQMTDRFGKVLEQFQPREVVPFTKQLENKSDRSGADSAHWNKALYEPAQEWITKDKLKLTESEKRILYGNYIPQGYTISPRTAYTMVSIMNDVVNYGTGYKVKELKRPAAGKTGTTNDETDVWFVGFTPELFTGVWVGFDEIKKIGGRETGGSTAAPIFVYYNQEVLKDKPVAQFNIPKEINMAALDAPLDTDGGDAEAGGTPGVSGRGGADFFTHDF